MTFTKDKTTTQPKHLEPRANEQKKTCVARARRARCGVLFTLRVAYKGIAIAYESDTQKLTDGPLTFEEVHRVEWRLRDAVLILAILAVLAILVVLVALAMLVVATKLSKKRKTTVTKCCWRSNSNFPVHVPIAVCLLRLDVVVPVVLGNVGFRLSLFLFYGCKRANCSLEIRSMFRRSWFVPHHWLQCEIVLISWARTTCRDPWDGNRRESESKVSTMVIRHFLRLSTLFVTLPSQQDGIIPFLFPQFTLYLSLPNDHVAIGSAQILLLVSNPFSRCSTEWTRSRIDFWSCTLPARAWGTSTWSMTDTVFLEASPNSYNSKVPNLWFFLFWIPHWTCWIWLSYSICNDRFCLICRSQLVHEFLHFGHSSLIFEHCILWNSLNLGDQQFSSASGLALLDSGPCCWCCFDWLPGLFENFPWSGTRRGNSQTYNLSTLKGY